MENTPQLDELKEQQLHKAESLSRVSLTLVDDLFTSGREVPDEFRKEILTKINDLQQILIELNKSLQNEY